VIPIFVLTLKGSRRETIIRKRLNKLNLKFKFFYGVDGKNKKNHNLLKKNYNKKIAEFNLGRKMPYSEIAASYGHLKIYKYIIKKKINRSLILEDDAWPSKSLKKVLMKKNFPKKFHLVGLNCYDGFVEKKPDFKLTKKFSIHKAKTHLITISAYLITLKACTKIIKKTKGKVITVPDWPINFIKNNINSSILLPYPVIIDDKNFSYLRSDRDLNTPKNLLRKILPNYLINFFSLFFYILHIPFLTGRYPDYNFFKEHFFDKKIAFLKNLILKNLINTKEIYCEKKFYLEELHYKVDAIKKLY